MITDLITPGALAVIALLVIPAVVGLVNMFKQAGLNTRWAGPVAVTLGLLIMITYGLFGEHKMFVYALIGILVGLGSVGLYDLTKLLGKSSDATVVVERPVGVTFPAVTDATGVEDGIPDGLP